MTKHERACQLWTLLAWAATCRQILTYPLAAQLTGVPPPALGGFLEPIQSYCELHGLPPLTTICVGSKSGLPGAGNQNATAADLGAKQMEVFAYDWLAHGNPGPDKLAEALMKHPTNANHDMA